MAKHFSKNIRYRYWYRGHVSHEAWVDHEVHHSRCHGRYHCYLWCRRRSSYFRTTRRGTQVHTLQVSFALNVFLPKLQSWRSGHHLHLLSKSSSQVLNLVCTSKLIFRLLIRQWSDAWQFYLWHGNLLRVSFFYFCNFASISNICQLSFLKYIKTIFKGLQWLIERDLKKSI